MWEAEIRLLSSLYTFDRPYSYISDTPCRAGMIAALPFGTSNRQQYGVVTAVKEFSGNEESLKKISFFLPEPYSVSEQHTELAKYMSERLFTSFGDCVRLMLPSGINFKTEEYYEKGESYEGCKKDEKELASRLISNEKGVAEEVGREKINSLVRRGIILKKTKPVCRVNEKYETVITLDKTFEKSSLDAKLKGSRKKEIYLRVVNYLEGCPDGVEKKTLCGIYPIGADGVKYLEKKGIISIVSRRVGREAYDFGKFEKKSTPPVLSEEQKRAFDTLSPLLDSRKGAAALLWGVTGSGKTSVILSLADRAVKRGEGVIILVPEIALTLQNASLLFSLWQDKVAVIHSGMSEGERQDAWEALKEGRKSVVLGTRSAVFAPVANLSMIVIDEEQDDSYKSDQSPRYNARDIARFRCAKGGALMLLASATPDVETFWRAEKGKYTLVKLTERYGNSHLPEVLLYDTVEAGLMPDRMIGDVLEEKLRETLERGEQAILFLNRRGLRKILICRDCRAGVSCPNCSVPMTLHLENGAYTLMCHWCGYKMPPPNLCPNCSSRHMQYRGYGTQKLEEELHRILPQARVLRMDADTTGKKFSHDEIISRFASHDADILIGTQMVTKGHNFPDVTLVGVVMADLSLSVSDYRACEHTFALLTQVVGRAGRGDKPGCALIQTCDAEGEVIRLCTTQDYEGFYRGEIALRKSLLFPPFCSAGAFFLTSDSEKDLDRATEKINSMLAKKLSEEYRDVKIIAYGPFEAFPYKLKNRYRRKLAVKYKDSKRTRELFGEILKSFGVKDNTNCIFDPTPSGI